MPRTDDGTGAVRSSDVPVDFEAIFDTAPCGYLIVDDDGSIVAVNGTFLRWAGYTRQALVGTNFSGLLPVGDRILYSTLVVPQLRVNGSVAEVVIEITAVDGTRRPALLSASFTPASADVPAHSRVIIFSAVERRRYEKELVGALQRARESDARRAQAQTMAESTQHFQDAVFATTPDTIAVWEVETESVLWANRSLPGELGFRSEDASATATSLAEHLVVAEDVDKITAALATTRTAADREVAEVEFRMNDMDGTTRWFSRRTTPLTRDKDGRVTQIIAITSEITTEKTVADQLREREGLFRQLAESVDVAFFVHRGDPPQYLYVSPGFVKIFGHDPTLTAGTPVSLFEQIHPEDRDRFLHDYWKPSQQGRPAQIDCRVVRLDGQTRWIRSITAPVMHAESGEWRYATTSEDITMSRQAESALLAAEVADRANAAKNDFLSRMSHELRTPLNAVLGFAQLLELDPLTGDQQSGVRHILRGGRHLLGLIDDVLEISKIESDRLDLSMEPVPVATLLSETVELMMPLAVNSGVTLRFDADAIAGCRVHADQRRLRQVLINLLSNAVKYNRREGRVVVLCRTSPPGTSPEDARLDIDVADTGRGIRKQDLPRLFTPFDRLGAESTGVEGTGVGLALSRRLMTLMGGTLTATSEIGVGSTFSLCLPLIGQHVDRSPSVDAIAVDPSTAGLRHARTVVYIEDNSSNVDLMEQVIKRRPQWRMLVAGTGEVGIELAMTAGVDLVLLDLHLPDANGMDLLHTLRADPATRQLEIVVLSADASVHQQARLHEAGANAYLTKPIDVVEVLALLDRAGATVRPGH